MDKAVTQETNQATGDGEHLLLATLIGGVGVKAQLTAILFPPGGVEVEDDGDEALVLVPELVQVFAVIGPGGIDGEVSLELEKTQEEGAVNGQTECLQGGQVAALGRGGGGRVQPPGPVGPDRGVELGVGTLADAGVLKAPP